MTNYKKISVDFHGVITADPEFFGELMRLWHAQGVKIYVVSGGPQQYITQYLATHQIPYDVLWCIFDYYNAKQKIAVAADGSFHIADDLWNKAKGQYCAREHIELHIDDSKIYGKYFTTPYVRFDALKHSLEINNTELPLSAGVNQVAAVLEMILAHK